MNETCLLFDYSILRLLLCDNNRTNHLINNYYIKNVSNNGKKLLEVPNHKKKKDYEKNLNCGFFLVFSHKPIWNSFPLPNLT